MKLQSCPKVLGFQVFIGFRHPTRVDPTYIVSSLPTFSRCVPSRAMSKMNKADYVQQLQQLGENPPRSWTIAELRSRITELREERGLGPVSSRNHTPLRTMMIEMNKASKKKGDLINYVEQSLGGHVTNNMTISQIQRVAVKKIYMSTSPSSSDPVGFGEHCAMTYEQLLHSQESYVAWVKKIAKEGDCDYRLSRLATWLENKDQYPLPPRKEKPIATFGVVMEEKPRTYGPPELEQKGYPGKPMDPRIPSATTLFQQRAQPHPAMSRALTRS